MANEFDNEKEIQKIKLLLSEAKKMYPEQVDELNKLAERYSLDGKQVNIKSTDVSNKSIRVTLRMEYPETFNIQDILRSLELAKKTLNSLGPDIVFTIEFGS